MAVDSNQGESDPRVACPVCGMLNASWHSHCDECGTRLIRPDDADPMIRTVERPGWLTGWAILFGGYVLLDGLLKLMGVLEGTDFRTVDTILLLAIMAWMVGALWIIGATWRRRSWARLAAVWVHVVLIGLFVAGQVYSLTADDSSDPINTSPAVTTGPVDSEDEPDPFESPVLDLCGSAFWIGLNVGMAVLIDRRRDLFLPRDV